jgi:hypothetical protein|tara:strand:+ start:563 stop:787 length:225 start_codon:yes stop_codon:yes gene_type:complete
MTNRYQTRIDNIEHEIKSATQRLKNWERAISLGSEDDSFDIRFGREFNAGKCKQELKKLNSKLNQLQGVVDVKR